MTEHEHLHASVDLWSLLDLPRNEITVLKKYKVPLLTLEEFMLYLPQCMKPAYLFCLDRPKGRMAAQGTQYGLLDWSKARHQLHINLEQDFSCAIEQYLDRVIATGKQLVFFIPPDLWTNKRANVTRYELWYLLEPEHREALSRLLLVLDLLDAEV